jgi:hypothetical protein
VEAAPAEAAPAEDVSAADSASDFLQNPYDRYDRKNSDSCSKYIPFLILITLIRYIIKYNVREIKTMRENV